MKQFRIRLLMPLVALIALLTPADSLGQGGKEKARGVAVVELFTSQGCSSCPPADELLRQIQATAGSRDAPVHVLSFHVDYWNRLGWTDPYSNAISTRRQRGYASAAGSKRIYTPQMIVNGTTEFVGSSKSKAHAAISDSLARQSAVTVELDVDLPAVGNQIKVSYQVAGKFNDRVLNLAAVQTPTANAVPRGENSGRELSHVNIVRAFKTVPIKSAAGTLTIALPKDVDPATIRIIAFVQDSRSMAIVGATATK